MSKRLLILACGVALVAAACGTIPEGEVESGSGVRFTPFVVDSLDDSGLGAEVTVGPEGAPFMSYFALDETLEEGEIPLTRPVGAPFIPAIGVASLSPEGIWTRGAAAQSVEAPAGVVVPYGPATVESLKELNALNSNGADIAVAEDGAMHVVWTAPDGLWYAVGPDGFEAEKIFDYGVTLPTAGPIGRPSVAVDAQGVPWIAYTVNAESQEVRVVTREGDAWATTTVATIPQCDGCPQPKATRIVITPEGPVVAYADTSAGTVNVVRLGEPTPGSQVVSDSTGDGLSMAASVDGAVVLSFYTEQGVAAAVSDGGGWTVADVGGSPAAEGKGNLAPTTGVAVDEQGTVYVAYEEADALRLVAGSIDALAAVDTPSTAGGSLPSLAATADGTAVYMTWYEEASSALRFGIYGDPAEVAIAAPSPTAEPAAPAGPSDCGADGAVFLDIVALNIAFDTNCLVAPGDEAFTINFHNQDAGIPHNVAIYAEQGGETLFQEPPFNGVKAVAYDVEPLAVGSYYFQCDVHPTMAGSLVTVEGAGK